MMDKQILAGGFELVKCNHCGGTGKCDCEGCYEMFIETIKKERYSYHLKKIGHKEFILDLYVDLKYETFKENKFICSKCNGFGFLLLDINGNILKLEKSEETVPPFDKIDCIHCNGSGKCNCLYCRFEDSFKFSYWYYKKGKVKYTVIKAGFFFDRRVEREKEDFILLGRSWDEVKEYKDQIKKIIVGILYREKLKNREFCQICNGYGFILIDVNGKVKIQK